MIDYTKLQQYSQASSNKVWRSGSGSFTVAALVGAGETFNIATIPHTTGNRDLLYQVTANITPALGSTYRITFPWAPGDNRQIAFAAHDTVNLYIYFISTDSSGLGEGSFLVEYTYRILVP
jgi:hypothetical protein